MSEVIYTESYPPERGIELERSVVSIPIHLGDDEIPVEILKLDALMKLERQAPVLNSVAIRQFEFQIKEWELYGYSTTLNSNITFTLSDTPQPLSICMATNPSADFPATIVYSAIYDVYVGTDRVISQQPGVAFAHGIRQIPPRGVMIAFQKQFERDGVIFAAGACGAMATMSPDHFERELARARSMRGL